MRRRAQAMDGAAAAEAWQEMRSSLAEAAKVQERQLFHAFYMIFIGFHRFLMVFETFRAGVVTFRMRS